MTISWNDYHIGVAQSIAKRSKDPSTQVGCVIVTGKNDPISQGYNGNVPEADETFLPIVRPQKYLTILHAEQNAILRTGKTPDEMRACKAKAYITDGPCETCLKLLLASGIREIWYGTAKIMRERSSAEQKAAIRSLIKATNAEVKNINHSDYLDELGVKMQIVIGLAGVKTAGKSTVTNIIRKHFPLKEAALAEKLKNVCAQVFQVPRDHFDDQAFKEVPFETPRILTADHIRSVLALFGQGYVEDLSQFEDVIGMELKSPRQIAQIVGSQILRRVGEDIHCENIELAPEGITVVSDMRFPNEFAYLSKKEGIKFIPIYIKRDEAEAQVTPDSHISETSVFQFSDKCEFVDNNGTLEQTEAQVMAIINRYLQA